MDSHLLFELSESKKIHLGITGSIAAYKVIDLMRAWQQSGIEVGVTLTESAQKFVCPLTFEALGAKPVYSQMFQEPFAHLATGKDADIYFIAPASADTIAQIAVGRADTLLAAQVLAFPKQVILAPAMNPYMWANQATQDNISLLKDRDILIVGPEKGRVACNDEGEGRFASQNELFLAGLKALVKQDLKGKTVLVTLGATKEPFDDVRYWTNGSTGTMGMCLAIAAWLRGARVHAICGSSVALWYPKHTLFQYHKVDTALNMLEIASKFWKESDYGIFTAAVADFRPESHGPGKFHKAMAQDGFTLRFFPNQDILKLLASEKQTYQKVVAFAAEDAGTSEELAGAAIKKLNQKHADMVVGNSIIDGFGTKHNRVFVADRLGREEHWPELPKTEVAWNILTWLLSI